MFVEICLSLRHKVLNITDGITDMGEVKWDLCLCLVFAWLVIYFCIWKGIRATGKVSSLELLLKTVVIIEVNPSRTNLSKLSKTCVQ